ncbi:MAG: DNA primase noncatalytic subunit PriX [Candidatus Micrarchaeaceae archaeon]
MHADTNELLAFAYKYSFSEEAKEFLKQEEEATYDDKFATAGLLRVNEDLEKQNPEFVSTSYKELMRTYVMSYVYARMIVSATGNMYIVKKFAMAEAARAASALAADSLDNIAVLSAELGIGIKAIDSKPTINVFEFLKAAKDSGLHLQDMRLHNGIVEFSKQQAISLLKGAMVSSILKGLPISKNMLPKEVFAYAKELRLSEPKLPHATSNSRYAWIDALLATPIPDVRHRSVNLILAPYLTNIKGLDADTAANIIIEYIEKCKQLNPNTRINDTYIKYQCRYAKEHGLKPLSLLRAKELFKGIIEL